MPVAGCHRMLCKDKTPTRSTMACVNGKASLNKVYHTTWVFPFLKNRHVYLNWHLYLPQRAYYFTHTVLCNYAAQPQAVTIKRISHTLSTYIRIFCNIDWWGFFYILPTIQQYKHGWLKIHLSKSSRLYDCSEKRVVVCCYLEVI